MELIERNNFLSAGTITSIMMHACSSKFFIVMSGQFASIFLSVFILKSHRIVTSVLSGAGCGVFSEILSISDCKAC